MNQPTSVSINGKNYLLEDFILDYTYESGERPEKIVKVYSSTERNWGFKKIWFFFEKGEWRSEIINQKTTVRLQLQFAHTHYTTEHCEGGRKRPPLIFV